MKKKYYIIESLVFILFLVLQGTVKSYWGEQPFAFNYTVPILTFCFLLNLILIPKVRHLFNISKLLYLGASIFIGATWGAIVGIIVGNLMLVPFLTAGGEFKWAIIPAFYTGVGIFAVGILTGIITGVKKISKKQKLK